MRYTFGVMGVVLAISGVTWGALKISPTNYTGNKDADIVALTPLME